MLLLFYVITALQFQDVVTAFTDVIQKLVSGATNSSVTNQPTTIPSSVNTSKSPSLNQAPLPSGPTPSIVTKSIASVPSESPLIPLPSTVASPTSVQSATPTATSTATPTDITKAAVPGGTNNNEGFWTPLHTAYVVVPSSIAIIAIAYVIRRKTKSNDTDILPTSRRDDVPSPPL